MTTLQKNQITANLNALLLTAPELEDFIRQALEALSDINFIEMFTNLVKDYAKQRFLGNEVADFDKWFIIFKTIYKVLQSEACVAEIKFLF